MRPAEACANSGVLFRNDNAIARKDTTAAICHFVENWAPGFIGDTLLISFSSRGEFEAAGRNYGHASARPIKLARTPRDQPRAKSKENVKCPASKTMMRN